MTYSKNLLAYPVTIINAIINNNGLFTAEKANSSIIKKKIYSPLFVYDANILRFFAIISYQLSVEEKSNESIQKDELNYRLKGNFAIPFRGTSVLSNKYFLN